MNTVSAALVSSTALKTVCSRQAAAAANTTATSLRSVARAVGASSSSPSPLAFLRPSNSRLLSSSATANRHERVSVGTDLLSSTYIKQNVSLQEARPWYMEEEAATEAASTQSNLAADNQVSLHDLFASDKTVGVFAVPAPFTGTCTTEHYPGYARITDDLYTAGLDELICLSVADPYAHHAWARSMGNHNNDASRPIRFLADPDASFCTALGVERAYDACSLGLRSERFRMIVQAGVVTSFELVENAAADAASMLDDLQQQQQEQTNDKNGMDRTAAVAA